MVEADPLPLVVRDLSFQYRSRTEPAIVEISLELLCVGLLKVNAPGFMNSGITAGIILF
jgi:hypothetical protein